MNEREPLFQEQALRRMFDVLLQQWRGAPAIARGRPTVVNFDWSTFGTYNQLVGFRALLVMVPETTAGHTLIETVGDGALRLGEQLFEGRAATLSRGEL